MTEQFDVFLCHNSQDKPEVIKIANQLRANKLNPWLDVWHLRPGFPWQRELEKQITNIKAVAVFVGDSGIGPWQEMEIEAYLRRFVNQGIPVIPTLLHNAPKTPKLPVFLEGMTWVDFRVPEAMERLIWGITGVKPKLTLELESKTGQGQIRPQKAENFTEYLGNEIKLEMIAIPAGEFMMGSEEYEDEQPIHRVQLKEFWLSKYPITQAQYQAVMGENPSYFKGENNPVEQVSWNDAQDFCKRLSSKTGQNYKLPSEAQWEYACRAGSRGKWCFGNNEFKLQEYAWYSENSNSKTHPLGEKKPNDWGLFDMHGNVWEWCQDDWHDNYKNAPNDGSAWKSSSSKHVLLRGGSFDAYPDDCRSAYRFNNSARDGIIHNNGFCVVCVLPKYS